MNFRIGGVLAYIEDWDIYGEPTTRLPVLDGGFDQTILMLGVIRRFRRDSR